MRKRLTVIATAIALLVLVSAVVVVAGQAIQLVELADRVSSTFGDIVLWVIVAVFALCLAVPLFLLFTLPAPLVPPNTSDGPELERHLQRLGKRLATNPHVTGAPVGLAEIETALGELDAVADARTKAAALQVFLTTAISQNGSLDALLVLAAQSKLVLEIARTYYQRPTLRDLLYLYSNVAATAFIAGEIEDIDLSEQMEPVITAVLGSTVAAIPGMGAAANLFVGSVTTGAGNAYLTLRVGIIARQYCRSLARPERRATRRSAALQAAKLLGAVARDGAASVAAAIWAKPKQHFSDAIAAVSERVTAIGDAAAAKGAATWNALTGRESERGGDTAGPPDDTGQAG